MADKDSSSNIRAVVATDDPTENAIQARLKRERLKTLEAIEAALPEKGYFGESVDSKKHARGYNQALTEVKKILEDMKNAA